MNKIGKRSFYKAVDNLSKYCIGFQAIFALAVGIFFLARGVFALVKDKAARLIVLSFVYGAVLIVYAFFYNSINSWLFFGVIIVFSTIVFAINPKKVN